MLGSSLAVAPAFESLSLSQDYWPQLSATGLTEFKRLTEQYFNKKFSSRIYETLVDVKNTASWLALFVVLLNKYC